MRTRLPPLDSAGRTDTGLKRKKNEDAFRILIPPSQVDQAAQGALFLVTDGIGGMGGGDVASQATIEELIRSYYASEATPSSANQRIQTALENANAFVREQARHLGLPRIGAALVGMVLTPSGMAMIFNVGDCRLYRIRQGVIKQLSRDQSIMAEQMAQGGLSEAEALVNRNMNLTAFIGQPVPLEVSPVEVPVQAGDTFILCSDGLWSLVPPDEICRITLSASADSATASLIRIGRERGAPDNLTAVIVRVKPASRFRWWQVLVGLVALILVGVSAFALLNNASRPAASPTLTQERRTATLTRTPDDTQAAPLVEVLASQTPLPSATRSLTYTPSPTSTRTPTATASRTSVQTMTAMPSPTQTPSPSRTPTPTMTTTPSATVTASATVEPTVTLNATAAALLGTSIPPEVVPVPTGNAPLSEQAILLEIARSSRGVILTEAVNLTTGVSFPLVTAPSVPLPAGTRLRFLRRAESGSEASPRWWQVVAEATDGREQWGWLREDVLGQVQVSGAVILINVPEANVRQGDSTAFEVIVILRRGVLVDVFGQSQRENGWYAVRLPDGREGWVSAEVSRMYPADAALTPIAPPPEPLPTGTLIPVEIFPTGEMAIP